MAVDQTASVLLELYRAARESPIPEFQERALQLLKPLCRFDSAMWGVGEVRPDTGLALHSIHLHNLPQEMFTSYEEIKNHDLPAFEAARRMGEVCTFNLRDMMPGSRYSDVASFDARYGLQNLLVTTTHDSVLGSVGFIALWREKDRDRYTEDERRCGETLMPHFFEAGTTNQLVWLSRMTATVVALRGARAIASRLGALHLRDEQFLYILQKEWPDWSPPALPGTLLESLRRSPGYRFIGRRIAVTAKPAHGMLFLLAREKTALERLSPAQLDVATLIANGLSYKEVARKLSRSPATVRNELHTSYVKLGINNKAALARCLSERDIHMLTTE
jgi:DNA-binding CsgD family transcriptional regulator